MSNGINKDHPFTTTKTIQDMLAQGPMLKEDLTDTVQTVLRDLHPDHSEAEVRQIVRHGIWRLLRKGIIVEERDETEDYATTMLVLAGIDSASHAA